MGVVALIGERLHGQALFLRWAFAGRAGLGRGPAPGAAGGPPRIWGTILKKRAAALVISNRVKQRRGIELRPASNWGDLR